MHLFLQSMIRYLAWWGASLWPGKHEGAPLGLRRLVFLLLGYPLFLGLQLVHWLGFLCDEIFFSAYRKVEVESPVFIHGIPRSGTTFLHRTLAADPNYTYFTTWEAILAPSITERKVVCALAAIDRAIGAPCKRLIQACLNKSSADFNAIHEVGLDTPEEDYLALLPAGGCFILLLAFPFSKELTALAKLDQMPASERERWILFYKRCLQKHLYCHPGKQLLSKNAAFATWGASLQEAFPDAHFLICIREPDTALSSQLSSLAPARKAFGTDPNGSHTSKQFTDIYSHAYQALKTFVDSAEQDQVAVVVQAKLKADPAGTIRSALEQIGLETPPGLDQLKPSPSSGHHHKLGDFNIDPEPIERRMQTAYERMQSRTVNGR